MTNFTVRVELLGYPDAQTYLRLEAAMKTIGFTDEILEPNGSVYELPPAEYIGVNINLTTLQVVERVRQTVTPIWKDHRVFVTQAYGRWEYYNLKKIK